MLQRCMRRTRALCLLTGLAVAACSAPPRQKVRLEAYSWWVQTSERDALQSVLDLYNSKHHDSEFYNPNTADADAVRATLNERLLAAAPPATFQANAGSDLLRWTVIEHTTGNDLRPVAASESLISPLSDLYEENHVSLPEPLREALFSGSDHAPYAVPLDIHRLNVLYYNTAKQNPSFLERDVLCPPAFATREVSSGDKLPAKIAIGMNDGFSLVLFALESMLPAIAGGEVYERLFRGHPPSDWGGVRHALRCVQYLSHSFVPNERWTDALSAVGDGTADFTVMGDWSNAPLQPYLQTGKVDAVPFPGASDVFVFTSDTFPLPAHSLYQDETKAFLASLLTPQAQIEFSLKKGSIPALNDIDLSRLGPRAIEAYHAFNADTTRRVLATSGLFPPYFPGEMLNSKLWALTAKNVSGDGPVDELLGFLQSMQPIFERWQRGLGLWNAEAP